MKEKLRVLIGAIMLVVLVAFTFVINYLLTRKDEKNLIVNLDPELQRAMTYGELEERDARTNSDYVQFSAFFLRDLDQDGFAERVKGTCKEVAGEDTLYMSLNVLTDGILKNGKIEIISDNIYFQTVLVDDEVIKGNYVSANTNVIDLKDVKVGTQKLIFGNVRTGNYSSRHLKTAALENDTTKYSGINKVKLTGTHVKTDGTETQIEKIIELPVDWYAVPVAEIPNKYDGGKKDNQKQNYDMNKMIDEENEKLNLTFNIVSQEKAYKSILSKSYIEGEIPQLNGYDPISVEITGERIVYEYDSATRKFSAQRVAELDSNGVVRTQAYSGMSDINRYNEYKFKVTYPLEAYTTIGIDTVNLNIPVKAYYEGYNNQNEEFTNPIKSNVAEAIITAIFERGGGDVVSIDVKVGRFVKTPYNAWVVSKVKPEQIYEARKANEEIEQEEDLYEVMWYVTRGADGTISNVKLKETDGNNYTDKVLTTENQYIPMEEFVSNKGIYFEGAQGMFGSDGYIKVLNDETGEEIHTFTKQDWGKYDATNPYEYSENIKHIRIETSEANPSTVLTVHSVKEIDDEKLTTLYTEEQFEKMSVIYSYLTGYVKNAETEEYRAIKNDQERANYDSIKSIVEITSVTPSFFSTQETKKNAIVTIETEKAEYNTIEWQNGEFLLKFPKNLLEVKINRVNISTSNVEIVGYSLEKREDGIYYLKIITENETPEVYSIQIDCDITPDPRVLTSNENFELYGINQICESYRTSSADKYDVDGDGNITEIIGKAGREIQLIGPASLITIESASEYNENHDTLETTVAPQIAIIDKAQDEKTAKVSASILNNYSGNISGIKLVGKIPFEGNKFQLNDKEELGSTYTTTLIGAIEIPEDIREYTTVYYSENEIVNEDLGDATNNWVIETEITDYSRVRNYLIDLGTYVMKKGEEQICTYKIELPEGLDYNEVAYSTHAAYFYLETIEGKLFEKTETNKLGFMIAKKYNLQLEKTKEGTDVLLKGATYQLTDDVTGEKYIATTNSQGILEFKDLFVEKSYTLQEIKAPYGYERNQEEIKIATEIDENGNLRLSVTGETVKGRATIAGVSQPTERIFVEDAPKYTVKLEKYEKGTDSKISNVVYELSQAGAEKTKQFKTNRDGTATISELSLDTIYNLKEIRAKGYYIDETEIEFKVVKEGTQFRVEITNGNVKGHNIVQNNENSNMPEVTIEVENEKIPTYNLSINKYAKNSETKLQNATYKITGPGIQGEEKLKTNEEGKIDIEGLYEYVEGKNVDGIYTIRETVPPQGYMLNETEIKIKAQRNEEGKLVLEIISGDLRKVNEENDIEVNEETKTITIGLEDEPLFKLIKIDGTTSEALPNTKFTIEEIIDEAGNTKPAENVSGEQVGELETINGKEYRVVSTNENGEISVELKTGVYKIIELEAVRGYVLPEQIENRTYYFGIGKNTDEVTRFIGKGIYNYDGQAEFYEYERISLDDGKYISVGYFYTGGIIDKAKMANNQDYYVSILISRSPGFIKYNSDNLIEWVTYIDTYFDYYAYRNNMHITEDNKILFINPYNRNGYIIINKEFMRDNEEIFKSDAFSFFAEIDMNDGKIEFCKTSDIELYHGGRHVYDNGIVIAGVIPPDKDFIIEGSKTISGESIELERFDTIIYKLNLEGKYEWITSFGKSNNINYIYKNSDGTYTALMYLRNNITITGENTSSGQSISVNTEEFGSDIKIIIESDGKIKSVKKWYDSEVYQSVILNNNTYVYCSLYHYNENGDDEEIIIGAEETANGEEIKLETNDECVLIKYNQNGKIEWVNQVEWGYECRNCLIAQNNDIIVFSYNSRYIIGQNGEIKNVREWKDFLSPRWVETTNEGYNIGFECYGGYNDTETISTDETVDGREYNIEALEGKLVIKYNSENKVIGIEQEAEEQYNGLSYSDYIYDNNKKYAIGAFKGNLIIPKENTSNNEEISLNNEGLYLYTTVITKFDENDKIEWIIPVGKTYSYDSKNIQKTSDGYYTAYLANRENFTIKAENTINNENIELAVAGNSFICLKINEDGKVISANKRYGLNDNYYNKEKIENGLITAISVSSALNVPGEYTVSGETINSPNIRNRVSDLKIIKYNSEGLIEWVKSIGSEGSDSVERIKAVNDGYVLIGYFYGNVEIPGEDTVDGQKINLSWNVNYGRKAIIKYNTEGKVVWARALDNEKSFYINGVGVLNNGELLINRGTYREELIIPSDQTVENNGDIVINGADYVLTKYDENGYVIWAKADYGIYNIYGTSDGGFIAAVSSINIKPEESASGESMYEKNPCLYLVKYNNDGKAEKYYALNGMCEIDSICEKDGKYRVIGRNTHNGVSIIDIEEETVVPQIAPSTEIVVENEKQQFKITTDVIEHEEKNDAGEIVSVKGGSITGEDEEPYETVIYGENSIKEIKITPEEGYKILSIKINEKEIAEEEYTENEDGSITIKNFENMTENKHIVVELSKNISNIIVHHYEAIKQEDGTYEYTETKVSEDEKQNGEIGKGYVTTPKIDLERYTLIVDEDGNYIIPSNASGNYAENTIHVYYYYEEKNVNLTVYHYIEGTETPVPLKDGTQAEEVKKTGKNGEEYTTEELKETLDERYELVEEPSNAKGIYENDDIVVYYYYRLKQPGQLIVHHYIIKEDGTKTEDRVPLKGGKDGEKVPDEIVVGEEYGQSYTTEASNQIPDNFEYVERTDNWEGTIKNDVIEVIYYYKYTAPEILDQEISKDSTLDVIEDATKPVPYTIEYKSKIKKYNGDLQIIIIDKLQYEIDEEVSELDGGVYDKETKTITWAELIKDVNIADEEVTYERTKNISLKYKNINKDIPNVHNSVTGTIKLKTPELTETVENDKDIPQEIPTISYIVNYYDIDSLNEETGEYTKIAESKEAESIQGTEITVESEIVENIDEYYYIQSDVAGEEVDILIIGTDENKNVINLYYKKALNSTAIIEKHVDYITGEVIYREVHEGKEGDEYEIKPKPQDEDTEEIKEKFEGYELVQDKIPENAKGTMKETPEEVIFYYKKASKVIVKYINSYTNEVIETEEKIYVEGDEYNIIPKDISGYDLYEEKKPENTDGIVEREDIEIKYYYKEKATLVVEYVDENGNKIINDNEKDAHVGDTYEVDKVLLDGYNFRGMPDNYKGTIENKNTVVKLVYDKIYSDDTKADTTIPKTMDKNMRKVFIISGMVALFIYSISVMIRWIIVEKKNK